MKKKQENVYSFMGHCLAVAIVGWSGLKPV